MTLRAALAALLLAASAHAGERYTRYPALRPWSTSSTSSMAAAVAGDSLRWSWTMPRYGVPLTHFKRKSDGRPDSMRVNCDGDSLLHSWVRAEAIWLPRFTPPFPPVWGPRLIWTSRDTFPGATLQMRIASPGQGSAWLEVVGPGGRSCRSKIMPSSTR